MISLLQRLFPNDDAINTEMLCEAAELLGTQRTMLREAARQIADWQDLAINAQRATRDLAIAFRAHQDTPEVDIREDLDELVQALQDSVAQFEEHISC